MSIIGKACVKAEGTIIINFPETTFLNSDLLPIDNVYLKYPFRVRLQDSLIYIMDIHPLSHYGHKFLYPSLEHQGNFIKRGQAPHESLDSENIRLDKHGTLWSLDANKQKLVAFSNDFTELDKTVLLDDDLIRVLDFDFLNDSTFVVPDYTGEYRINLINHEGKIIDRVFKIPASDVLETETPQVALAQAWRSFIDYNAEHGILAMATQLGQVLEIYDLKKKRTINIVKNEEPEFIVKGGHAIPNGIMGYSDVFVGNKSIYALFWGHSFEDIKKGKIKHEGGNSIHVFSLDGTPKIEYKLDAYITGFHINEKEKYILGLDVNSNQPLKKFRYD